MSRTNASIPSDLKVSVRGDLLVFTTRTATITVPLNRGREIARAILEVTG